MVFGNRTRGILCLLASAFGFAAMAACVRLCDDFGGPVGAIQKSFFRNLLAFFVALGAFGREARGTSFSLRRTPSEWRLMLLRSILGTLGIFANFYALSHIPIAEGQTLNKTSPFFTVLCTWLFLKEKVTRRQIFALLVAFAGVLCVTKPGFAGVAAVPLASGLFGGLCAGPAYACVRALGRKGTPPALIVLFFSAFSCLAAVPFVLVDFVPMTVAQIFILLGAGLGAALGQFGITQAYRLAPPNEIAVYDYSNIIFTAIFGYCLFGQIPDVLSLAGFVLIIAAAFFLRFSGRTPGLTR